MENFGNRFSWLQGGRRYKNIPKTCVMQTKSTSRLDSILYIHKIRVEIIIYHYVAGANRSQQFSVRVKAKWKGIY
jgi:hypothetical protein